MCSSDLTDRDGDERRGQPGVERIAEELAIESGERLRHRQGGEDRASGMARGGFVSTRRVVMAQAQGAC